MGRFNFKDEQDFDGVSRKAEEFYTSVGEVYCPYFGRKIAFNVKGLKHLRFKSDQIARSRTEQYARLKLIHIAPEVLKLSHTVQGIWQTKKLETQKTNSRWEHRLKETAFYEFIAVLHNVRVKVIVKEVQGGEKHFWSIIPYWKVDAENSRRVLHSGNPEQD